MINQKLKIPNFGKFRSYVSQFFLSNNRNLLKKKKYIKYVKIFPAYQKRKKKRFYPFKNSIVKR